MAKFTTRIELRTATEKDYDDLDTAMLLAGFKKTMISEDNSIFLLPRGEYNIDSKSSIKEIYQLAEKTANSTGKKNWILICETINRMWKLQEIFE